MARTSVSLCAMAMGIGLWLSSATSASAQSDLPIVPFDEIAGAVGDFAAFATNSTPVELPNDPTASAGQSDVAESPEPATLTLLGLGGVGAWWTLRRRPS